MIDRTYDRHITDKGDAVEISYLPFNSCYLVYVNGEFVESLDNYNISDRERLKMWERL